MNIENYNITLRNLSFQRNALLFFSAFLAVSTLLLSISHFFKNEKTIVVPPEIRSEFWVDSTGFSPSYLEQIGLYIGQLILSKSSESADKQRGTVLKHTHPQFAGFLNKKLTEEASRIQKEGISYVFFPLEVRVRLEKKEVLISGERVSYLNDRKLSSNKEEYLLSFTYSGGRLLLSGIKSQEVRTND